MIDLEVCPRCGCCSMDWQECGNCDEDGMMDHDCGEDCCCCLDPEQNVTCDICNGKTGWYSCIGNCDREGKHTPKSQLQPKVDPSAHLGHAGSE